MMDPIVRELADMVERLLPSNLGRVPDWMADSYTLPVDMECGEIRQARALLARVRGLQPPAPPPPPAPEKVA